MATSFDELVVFRGGAVFAGSSTLPAASVADATVANGAAISASKLGVRLRKGYAQESATTAASEARVIHVAYAAATLVAFKVGAVVANAGAATIAFDLKKNGTTLLTAPVSLTSSTSAYGLLSATFASTAIVAGDVLEVSMTATAGGGTLGKGAFCSMILDEVPA